MQDNLAQMRAERDRLDMAIAEAEDGRRREWNVGLDEIKIALMTTFEPGTSIICRQRKNVALVDVAGGVLTAHLGYFGPDRDGELAITAAGAFTMEWHSMPDAAKFASIVKVLAASQLLQPRQAGRLP